MIRSLKYLFQRVGEIWVKRERRNVPQLKSSAEITVPIWRLGATLHNHMHCTHRWPEAVLNEHVMTFGHYSGKPISLTRMKEKLASRSERGSNETRF